MDKCLIPYDDKQMLTDVLTHQKFMTSNYNSYLNESATETVRATFTRLLGEEHDIQFEVWKEMNNRGFYPTTKAEQTKVDAAKGQFEQVYACMK